MGNCNEPAVRARPQVGRAAQAKSSQPGPRRPSVPARVDCHHPPSTPMSRSALHREELDAIAKANAGFTGEYYTMNVVGRGQFGVVFRCSHKTEDPGFPLVAKLLRAQPRGAQQDIIRQQIQSEVSLGEALQKSPGENLMTLVKYYQHDSSAVLLYPYIPGGSVTINLTSRKGASCGYGEAAVRVVAEGLLRALVHLNDVGFAHLDVKPSNILLSRRLASHQRLMVSDIRLVDYGSATPCTRGRAVLRQVAGTLHFCAPEIVKLLPPARGNRPFDERCDVWSAGVVLFAMLLEGHPFVAQDEDPFQLPQATFCARVIDGDVQDGRLLLLPPPALEFFQNCLVPDFMGRWTPLQALHSDWLRDTGDDKCESERRLGRLSPPGTSSAVLSDNGSNLRGAYVPTICDAAASGDMKRLGELIAVARDLNRGDYDRRTPLHLAASEGHYDAVVLIANRGADLNVEDRWGGRPLDDSIREGHTRVAEFLRSRGAKRGVATIQPLVCDLCRAAAAADTTTLKRVLEGASAEERKALVQGSDYDNRTPLHLAASEGALEVVKYLCQAGAAVNAEDRWGGTPLADALRHGHHSVALYLRSQGGRSMGMKARYGAVFMLCDHAARGRIDEFASLYGDLSFDVSEEAVALINEGDYDHRTPLHLAASEGHLDMVKHILGIKGSAVNPLDRWKGTPLRDAVAAGHSDVVLFLKDQGGECPRTIRSPLEHHFGNMSPDHRVSPQSVCTASDMSMTAEHESVCRF
eukprot:TRINITY_DN57_c0_g3_i1.p1 TRINITY_DN57_c0_g3~~TRINITY_DN57_c0_g3_i1.p1  ORF type:complete len:751 (+),score=204.23 TRINITY_DN57_c0_g3_i1:55-2307(+)